jgi:ABC-type transporter MlaC component
VRDRELPDIFAIQDIARAFVGRRSKHTTLEEREQFRKRMRERLCGPLAEGQEVK